MSAVLKKAKTQIEQIQHHVWFLFSVISLVLLLFERFWRKKAIACSSLLHFINAAMLCQLYFSSSASFHFFLFSLLFLLISYSKRRDCSIFWHSQNQKKADFFEDVVWCKWVKHSSTERQAKSFSSTWC